MFMSSLIQTKSPKNDRLKKKLRTVIVDDGNYQALSQLGHPPDSFNTVVGRLIQEHFDYQKVTAGAAKRIK
jgi:hypothetical protein